MGFLECPVEHAARAVVSCLLWKPETGDIKLKKVFLSHGLRCDQGAPYRCRTLCVLSHSSDVAAMSEREYLKRNFSQEF